MADTPNRRQLSSLLEQRRRALLNRPEISDRVRQLSASGTRNPVNPRRMRRPALLTALVAGGALAIMLLCGISAVALVANGLWFHSQLGSPSVTAQSFYGALHQKDYATAYSYLSETAKAHISQGEFTAKFQAYDQVSGVVESYLVASTKVTGSRATVQMDVTRSGADGQAVAQTLTFVQQSGSWWIDSTSPPLWS